MLFEQCWAKSLYLVSSNSSAFPWTHMAAFSTKQDLHRPARIGLRFFPALFFMLIDRKTTLGDCFPFSTTFYKEPVFTHTFLPHWERRDRDEAARWPTACWLPGGGGCDASAPHHREPSRTALCLCPMRGQDRGGKGAWLNWKSWK